MNLHYDRSSTALSGEVLVADADAGAAVVRAADVPLENEEGPPARSTWGAERAVPPPALK